MTNVLAVTAIPVVFLPYIASLRRTPPRERKFWRMLSGFGFVLTILFAFVALTGHHISLGGAFAITLIPTMFLMVCAGFVEGFAANGEGPHDYRLSIEANRSKQSSMWMVRSVITDTCDDVEIRVCRDEYYRPVGTADPVAEAEAYHELLARANEIAGTLNSLGVETVSTAVVRTPKVGMW